MLDTVIKNAKIVLQDRVIDNHHVWIKNGKIETVTSDHSDTINKTNKSIDAAGYYLLPGFIDLHIHGLFTFLADKGPKELSQMCQSLPQYGVTAFLPTLSLKPETQGSGFLQSLTKAHTKGSHICGFHLEGPFLALTGALPAKSLGKGGKELVDFYIEALNPFPVIFSVSPEYPDIVNLIPVMSKHKALVFMTHTKASVKQTQAAIYAGARHATHFYDVFPCPQEQDPGVRPCGAVEAILADDRVSVDFILDGEHVDPVAVQMALRCKGKNKVCLITDSNIGAGLPPGKHWFGNQQIEFAYSGGPARLTGNCEKAGALAGSGLTMDRAVYNAMTLLNVRLPQAARMASANPASVLGLQKHKGRIAPGYDADFILVDQDINVYQTWVAGELVYSAERSIRRYINE